MAALRQPQQRNAYGVCCLDRHSCRGLLQDLCTYIEATIRRTVSLSSLPGIEAIVQTLYAQADGDKERVP